MVCDLVKTIEQKCANGQMWMLLCQKFIAFLFILLMRKYKDIVNLNLWMLFWLR